MKFINAMLTHAWLVLRLKHDGSGLPRNITGAFVLAALYITLSLTNARIGGDIKVGSFIALSFIVQFYVFCLRDKLIGLIILIGIITNVLSLVLSIFAGLSEGKLLLLTMMEFVMIFGAVINVIRSNTKII